MVRRRQLDLEFRQRKKKRDHIYNIKTENFSNFRYYIFAIVNYKLIVNDAV